MAARSVPDEAEIRAQGATCTVEFAGRVLRLGRTAAWERARSGVLYPGVPVLKVTARRWVVPVAALLRAVGIESPNGHDPPGDG